MSNNYKPFASPFKTPEGVFKGHNFIGVPKEHFSVKMKIYYDLPIPINGRTTTYREYNFLSLPNQTNNKIYGIETRQVKQNNQMSDCVNFFISDKAQLPIIDLDKDLSVTTSKDLFSVITDGMKKTKEWYAKNPPLPNQELKVFETTIDKLDNGGFKINNLTNKYMSGFLSVANQKYAIVYLPFDGQNKQILIPESQYHDNENGSFTLTFEKDQILKTMPIRKLKEIGKFDFVDIFKSAFKNYKQKEQSTPELIK